MNLIKAKTNHSIIKEHNLWNSYDKTFSYEGDKLVITKRFPYRTEWGVKRRYEEKDKIEDHLE